MQNNTVLTEAESDETEGDCSSALLRALRDFTKLDRALNSEEFADCDNFEEHTDSGAALNLDFEERITVTSDSFGLQDGSIINEQAEIWSPSYEHMYEKLDNSFSSYYLEDDNQTAKFVDTKNVVGKKKDLAAGRNLWQNKRTEKTWHRDLIRETIERFGDPSEAELGAEHSNVHARATAPLPSFKISRPYCATGKAEYQPAPQLVTIAMLAIMGLSYALVLTKLSGGSVSGGPSPYPPLKIAAMAEGQASVSFSSKQTKAKDGTDAQRPVASSKFRKATNDNIDESTNSHKFLLAGLVGASFKTLEENGYLALTSGQNEYAIAALSRAVKLNRNDARARQLLAHALVANDDPEAALAQFRISEQLKPISPTDQVAFGTALAESTSAKFAQTFFEDLIDQSESKPSVLLLIAKKCEALGLHAQAVNATLAGLESATTEDKHPFERMMRKLKSKSGSQSSYAGFVALSEPDSSHLHAVAQ